MKKHRFNGLVICAAALLTGCNAWPPAGSDVPEPGAMKPRGFIQLIEFHEDIQGIRNWAHELEQRDLTALINIQKGILLSNPDDVRWLSDHGHEIMGGYAGGALWDVPYAQQLTGIAEIKTLTEGITGKPMRVIGSAYFAYDETTLQVADELGIEFVLARGTSDVEAVIYKPDEYNCRIISVSNVTFADMGRGSLCDYSLYARGATAAEFAQILDDTLAKFPKRVMVVSHAYLGGMKQAWWDPYKELLDSDQIQWVARFDDWVKAENGVNIRVPLSLIPENREVKYETPTPAVPLDELEDVEQMYNPCGAP